MKYISSFVIVGSVLMMSCNNNETVKEETKKPYQLVTLDPGHFHAALVQKSMYDDVDSVVHVYAPEGNDVQLHLDRIKSLIPVQKIQPIGKKKFIPVLIFLKK